MLGFPPLTLSSFVLSFSPVSLMEDIYENSFSQQLPQDRGLPPRQSEKVIREFAAFKRSTQLLICLSAKAAAIKLMQTGEGLGGPPFSRMQLHYRGKGEA